MKHPVLIDTGPLVSFLSADQKHHLWTKQQWRVLHPPVLTCEAVLTEAAFLLRRAGREVDALFALLERGVLQLELSVQREQVDLRPLMARYRDKPMSLADACLVRMSELHEGSRVFTLDSDFRFYRRHGNRVIPVLMPD